LIINYAKLLLLKNYYCITSIFFAAGSLSEFGVMLQTVAEEWSDTIDRLEIQLIPSLEKYDCFYCKPFHGSTSFWRDHFFAAHFVVAVFCVAHFVADPFWSKPFLARIFTKIIYFAFCFNFFNL